MSEMRCPKCTLPIDGNQQVILAKFGLPPDRIPEFDVKPADAARPEVFHAWCLPLGWMTLGPSMTLAEALAHPR